MSERVTDLVDLRARVGRGQKEYFIALAGGGLRSSKYIELYTDGTWGVFNEIDGSDETFTDAELLASNVGSALAVGALFAD